MSRIETALVHGAIREGYADKKGAVNVPMYLSSTFHQESMDEFGEFDYARSGNPTRAALEKAIAELEGGHQGFAFATGMAAVSACFMMLSQKMCTVEHTASSRRCCRASAFPIHSWTSPIWM